MTEAETTQPVRLAIRWVKPSDGTSSMPRFHAVPDDVVHTLVTGSRYCRTMYMPIEMSQSPAGRTKLSPGESARRLVEISTGAFGTKVGKRFCGRGKFCPGPARGIGIELS